MTTPQLPAAQAAPGPAAALPPRLAAYLLIFSAGTACAFLGWSLMFAFDEAINALARMEREGWQIVLAGAAAVIAAAAVHARFMRAVRERRRLRLYGWALLGVLASHAAYAVLILAMAYFLKPLGDLREHAAIALLFGAYSLILGFLPNLLFAIGLGEALLLGRGRAAPARALSPAAAKG